MPDKLNREPGGIIITDCSKLPHAPTVASLRHSGWSPISQRATGLAEVAGVDLKWCHNTHWAPRWFVAFMTVAPPMAAKAGQKNVYTFLRDIRREQLVKVIGLLVTNKEVEADDVGFSIARLLARPVVFGAIRIHPDGRAEITTDDQETWRPASEDFCRGLDAEYRLTGIETPLGEAASILLAAYEKDDDGTVR